jgi:FixJ family two-component response regulator
VSAMKAGAVDFLAKPFRDQDMLNAVASALDRDRKRRESEIATNQLRTLFESLSQRQREIMTRVTACKMNKHIAEELGLKETTVKIHRGGSFRQVLSTS